MTEKQETQVFDELDVQEEPVESGFEEATKDMEDEK